MLAVLVPVCLAVIADISLLLWLGEKLSLFHLISLLLVVGIGIDYGLFFSRSETDVANRQRTLHSLFICSSSTIVVFGMLALSTLPVLNAIGQTVAIGVFASFLFAFTVAQQVSKRTS
jgi:predicted exporter